MIDRSTMRRLARAGSVVLGVFMIAFAILHPAFAMGAIFAAGGVVADLKETTTSDEHKVRDVSEALTYMDESYETPLDQMLRRLPKRQKPVENIAIEFVKVDRTPPRRDAATDDVTEGSAGAAVSIPSAGNTLWRPNDLVLLPNNASAPGAVLLVTSTDSNSITVRRLNFQQTRTHTGQAFGTVPAIADGEVLVRMSTSKTEFDAPSLSRMTMPEYDFNYVHTFDAVVRASDHRQRTKNYTISDWQRVRADNLIDFRRSIEYNYFFGERSITLDPDTGELRTTMAGITKYIDTVIDYQKSGITESSLVDMSRQIFTGNTGRKRRVWFVDARLAAELDKLMLAKMQHLPSRKIAGVQTTEYQGRFGALNIVHHPGFDELGYEHYGVVVDLANVRKGVMQPTEKIKLELKKTGVADGDAEQYIEKSTLEVSNNAVHFITKGI